jgi:hypothetical protein
MGGGCLASVGRRRRYRDEAAESGEGYATSNLFLKHPDATLATYVRRQIKHLKYASETIAKTLENHYKTYATSR